MNNLGSLGSLGSLGQEGRGRFKLYLKFPCRHKVDYLRYLSYPKL